jgi:hypothetical protein
MADPIVEEALKAIKNIGLVGGGSATPVITEKSGSYTPGRNIAVNGLDVGGVTATVKGSGYMGVDDEPSGSSLNPIAQLGLFSKVRRESSWLRFTTFAPVSENSGYLDIWDDRNFRMAPTASEGPRKNIPMHKPDVTQNEYRTKTLSGSFGLRLKAIRSAARAGQPVNQLVQRGIAAGIGNVLADLGINGNVDLPKDSDLNIQRSTVNGWFQRIRNESPQYFSKENGHSYHNGLWAGMLHKLDKAYRSDPGLAWGLTDKLASRWLTELTATDDNPGAGHPSIVNPLGQSLLNAMGAQANPMGKTGVIIPQMDDENYSSGEGYAGLAPTSVTNNGNGTLTFNINSLADSGIDRSETGIDGQRYVVIGSSLTGLEETVPVSFSDPNNTITTSTLLGSQNPSASASEYYVKWADTQSIALALWRFFVLVIQNGMRVYTVFYPQDETIEVIVHADIDYMVTDYSAAALVDDLVSPRFDIFQ